MLAVIAIGVILSFTVLFKTENIIVEGCSYYYDDQIISYSNVSLQQNIFIAKMNSTPQDIIDNFAYVEDARVDFNIPDTITITITDAVPAYYMTEGNNYLLISAKGRVLERTETKPDGLPELICGEVTGKEVGEYIKFDDPSVPDLLNTVANSLSDNSFTGIVGFDVTDTTAITLDYEGRIRINLGVSEDLDYKLRTAQAIIDKKLDPNHTGQVYGNLDVSTCSKNKMSRYVPAATVPQATMATSARPTHTATSPADGSAAKAQTGAIIPTICTACTASTTGRIIPTSGATTTTPTGTTTMAKAVMITAAMTAAVLRITATTVRFPSTRPEKQKFIT